MSLKGKVAVVTGGGRGIGKFIAQGLAEAGADIVIASRKVENCEMVAEDLKKSGVRSLPLRCDLQSETDINGLIDRTMRAFGKIDILINNSGIGWIAPTLDYPIDMWDRVINVNLRAPWILTQKTASIMKNLGGGKIVFISSIWGMRGIGEEIHANIAYHVSKGAINALVRDLAVKLAPYKINVNAIAPGLFETDMTKHFDRDENKEIRNLFMKCVPLDRMGRSDDIKALSVLLASSASDFMTGQVIVLDGGSLCSYMPSRL